MSSESFDTKFSRLASVLFELRHYPIKYFKVSPWHEELNIFQKIFCNKFLCRFAPCKLYKLRVCEKR